MKRLVVMAVLAFGINAFPCFADQALEQDRLSQIIRELELVRALVDRASDDIPRDTSQRISFKYGILADELLRLENAVRRHIDYQNSQPRDHWSLGTEQVPEGTSSQ